MGVTFTNDSEKNKSALGIDRVYLRLAIVGMLVVACFVALFSRLWFLQVLAAEDYRQLARENRVRKIYSEPPRGRILDAHNRVLVTNRKSLAVTIDRQIVNTPGKQKRVLRRLAKVLEIPRKELRDNLLDEAASPYKPVAVANDVSERKATWILERQESFRGVDVERLPIRTFPMGDIAAQVLGYVGEISPEDLALSHFKGAKPAYGAGDLVGKSGLEYFYDELIRGRPQVQKVVVDSAGNVVQRGLVREERPGKDLVLSLDARIQKLTEKALEDGIMAARSAGEEAPDGAVVVMDPSTGHVLALANHPTFDPSMLADGITVREFDSLGQSTPEDPDDDALLNRAIQNVVPPGSAFKPVTAGAAMWNGLASPYTSLDCDGSIVLPPGGGPGSVVFNNWTSADYGYMGFPESLEVSCDTFYYQLGWDLEQRFGPVNGDGSERFQRYMRMAGFGHETGIDLRYEHPGRVPDKRWCEEQRRATDGAICPYGWLPGYTVNMSIGQGELLVSPLQMAVTYAAIANGGDVLQPRLGMALTRTDPTTGEQRVVREFKRRVVRKLPLDAAEIGVIQDGLLDVTSGDQGTAASAFAGFPLDRYPVAGKTGSAQIGESELDLNRAWFAAYAPADDPQYVIAVYLNRAGHGGETAAPVARQILEGLFRIDRNTEVELGTDASG
jgi:penicillin-binding protein 2